MTTTSSVDNISQTAPANQSAEPTGRAPSSQHSSGVATAFPSDRMVPSAPPSFSLFSPVRRCMNWLRDLVLSFCQWIRSCFTPRTSEARIVPHLSPGANRFRQLLHVCQNMFDGQDATIEAKLIAVRDLHLLSTDNMTETEQREWNTSRIGILRSMFNQMQEFHPDTFNRLREVVRETRAEENVLQENPMAIEVLDAVVQVLDELPGPKLRRNLDIVYSPQSSVRAIIEAFREIRQISPSRLNGTTEEVLQEKTLAAYQALPAEIRTEIIGHLSGDEEARGRAQTTQIRASKDFSAALDRVLHDLTETKMVNALHNFVVEKEKGAIQKCLSILREMLDFYPTQLDSVTYDDILGRCVEAFFSLQQLDAFREQRLAEHYEGGLEAMNQAIREDSIGAAASLLKSVLDTYLHRSSDGARRRGSTQGTLDPTGGNGGVGFPYERSVSPQEVGAAVKEVGDASS